MLRVLRIGLIGLIGLLGLLTLPEMILAAFVIIVFAGDASAQPAEATRYRAMLTREARMVWGLNAPIATFAGQIHQESRWNPQARSPVGAQGLAQFMPGTSTWISGIYPSLADKAPANPTWAIRAMVIYDADLFTKVRKAENDCERFAFALSAYNGGLGWVHKRQALSPQPGRCIGHTCRINPGIRPAAQAENEGYPRLILQRHQDLYAQWGPRMCHDD